MRRSLRSTSALVTEGSPLHRQLPGDTPVALVVGGYMAGAFDLTGDAGHSPAAPSETYHCSDGEIYLKGEDILARLLRA